MSKPLLFLILIQILFSLTNCATRTKQPREIVPVRVEQSSTESSPEGKILGADKAIDLDHQTYAQTDRNLYLSPQWFRAILDRVYCVENVYLWSGNGVFRWACTNKDCSSATCLSSWCSKYSPLTLTISTERATSQNFPTFPDCKYGDTVKIATPWGEIQAREFAVVGLPVIRNREPGEVIPVRAEQSGTWENDEDKYGAHRAIDLNFNTATYTNSVDTGGARWFRVILNRVYCVKKIEYYRYKPPSPLTWSCTSTGCSTCQGSSYCKFYTQTVTTERAPSENLPTESDCRYGDTVKMETSDHDANGIRVYEFIIIRKQVPCLERIGKLQEAEKKVGSLKTDLEEAEKKVGSLESDQEKVQNDLKEEKAKVVDAENEVGRLKTDLEEEKNKVSELQEMLDNAEKKYCPGKGIWTVPGNLIGMKITKKMIQNWRKNGPKENLNYLGSLVNVMLTEKLAGYVECLMTVD